MKPLVHYIIVRRDMPTGAACAQITHAAGESACYCMWYLPKDTIAVVLGVRDEKQLKYYAKRLVKAKIEHIQVNENAGPLAGQMTAVGVVPTRNREAVFKVLKKLNPLREFEGSATMTAMDRPAKA